MLINRLDSIVIHIQVSELTKMLAHTRLIPKPTQSVFAQTIKKTIYLKFRFFLFFFLVCVNL